MSDPVQPIKIIVVGAGVAGLLTAYKARKLLPSGLYNMVIYEKYGIAICLAYNLAVRVNWRLT